MLVRMSRFDLCPLVRWCAWREVFDKRTLSSFTASIDRVRGEIFHEEDFFLTVLGVPKTSTLLARFVLAPRLLFSDRGETLKTAPSRYYVRRVRLLLVTNIDSPTKRVELRCVVLLGWMSLSCLRSRSAGALVLLLLSLVSEMCVARVSA
jgi:hypothetical protein